ncbi:hypothetical protein I5Q34_13210 [Streptomyces sp. AV19]|uniref:hypothetical protein n=1 Tax=Streptomyces sp. AV19 TaxID=2793068 RepID=UPI0018FEE83D|nr:hypothetical protein [Streptomyces sp. AV19]MBH1935222.1 hypothetical protein [Streptomyces sp. AV19]MDG4531123.1 hypothetical protein [Streptomyces sp. AV19]
MARSSSGVFVAGLTAAALAAVGYLAYEASAAPDRPARGTHASATPSGAASGKGGEAKGGPAKDAPPAVPANSGEGKRVVYSVGQKRVWLVGAAGPKGAKTFEVAPSTVDPKPGVYAVTSRDPNGTGSDGVPIEHIVRFHRDAAGVVFGFSAAVDGSSPDPKPAKKTGGIREKSADGRAMWDFAPKGTRVVVVP